MCYTGDILDPSKTKYDIKYYNDLAKELENQGAHILAIKDMAGLLKPEAAYRLISELKDQSIFLFIFIHMIQVETGSLRMQGRLKRESILSMLP